MRRPIPAPDPAPALRAPHVPLPPYRYVPGLDPHPFRHVGGHLYTDGSAPVEAPWQPGPWRQDPRWLHGLDLFDQRYYWESHEVFEALWHQVEPNSALGQGLQGLIQAGASVLKRHMGQPRAADRLHGVARARLLAVSVTVGARWRGVDLPATVAALDAFSRGGDWPRLVGA